jgi:hypothetical protein
MVPPVAHRPSGRTVRCVAFDGACRPRPRDAEANRSWLGKLKAAPGTTGYASDAPDHPELSNIYVGVGRKRLP